MTVQEDKELFERNYIDYVNRLEQGLVTICKEVKVPISDIKDSLISYPLLNKILYIISIIRNILSLTFFFFWFILGVSKRIHVNFWNISNLMTCQQAEVLKFG